METTEEAYDYRTKTNLLKSQEDYEKALSRTNPAGEQPPQQQMNYLLDALVKAKELLNPSSTDNFGKFMSVLDAIEKRVTDRSPAPNSGNTSYQAKNVDEYREIKKIDYEESGNQARNEMMKSIISPLKDFLFQKFGAGLQPQQQTMSQQQPMPIQHQQPIRSTQNPPHQSPEPQAPQSQMVYAFRSSGQYDVTCPLCGTLVAVALDSISVNRCIGCGTPVLVVEDIPENAEYIRQMKSNQWTEELTDKIKLAVQRYNEAAMTGLRLNTQPLVNKSEDTGNDPLMGTFLAVAVREGIKKYLGAVSTNTVNSLVEKNMDIETIWEVIPQGFKESMATYANENPNQLRYVLNPTWVIDAIRESNSSLAEYFTDHSSGKFWLEGIISGIRAKLSV